MISHPAAITSASNLQGRRAEKLTVLSWSALRRAGSRSDIAQKYLVAVLVNVITHGTVLTICWDIIQSDSTAKSILSLTALAWIVLFLRIAEQKTVYRYHIYESYGRLEHYPYYSKLEINIFKTTALVCMVGVLGAALVAGSVLLFVGPAAIGFLAGLRLLNFKIPITHLDSVSWSRYTHVTVDRKRKIIVTHQSDLTLGFEARFPDHSLFERYLDFLRKSLPDDAEFIEIEWKHDLI